MARYTNLDDIIAKLDADTEDPNEMFPIHWIKTFLNMQPTADVVPKSEVENILDGLMKEAREIADRYEKSANETSDYDYARIEYRGCQMGALLVLFKIAELKKKYAESGKSKREKIFDDLVANSAPYVDKDDETVFFCIKSKTFKQLRKKYTEG